MVRNSAFALCLALALTVPAGTVLAFGTDSGSSSTKSSSTQSIYDAAKQKVDEQQYPAAIRLLEQVIAAEPNNANALNYLGYSHRKLGDLKTAEAFYLKALAIEPAHLGANEYLGELYLQKGDIAKAEARLSVLQTACTNCEEYSELKEEIEAAKAKQQS